MLIIVEKTLNMLTEYELKMNKMLLKCEPKANIQFITPANAFFVKFHQLYIDSLLINLLL